MDTTREQALQEIWIAQWLRRNALRNGKELTPDEADLQARLMPEEERKAHLVAIALESKPLVVSTITGTRAEEIYHDIYRNPG